MLPGIRPAFVRGGYSAYLVGAVVFRLERVWNFTFYLVRAMQCITNFFQRVPEAGGPTVVETATGKQHFARNFGSNIGTKGIVFAGIVGFVPQQAEPAPPVPPLSQGSVASSYQRGPRTRASLQRERLQNLNDAYLKMHEEPFECLVELLDIKQAELDSVFAMKPAKRRKLQACFNLLARCDG